MQSIAKEKFQVIGLEENAVEETARPRIGYFQDAWRRLRQNKVATLALFILIAIVIMVIIGPKLSGYAYEEVDKAARNQFPNAKHWFGTDKLGRDMFARVWISGRVSLIIGVAGYLQSLVAFMVELQHILAELWMMS